MPIDVEQSLEICEAATAGPWEYVRKISGSENHKGFFVRAQKPSGDGKWALADVMPGDEDGTIGNANATFIAHAREGYPAALRELLTANARIAELESRLARLNELVGFYLRLNAEWEGKDICVPHRHRTELRELLEV